MATVLMCWELGGGMGHLTRLLPLIRGFTERGNSVVAIVQDVIRARGVFAGAQVKILQAPARPRSSARKIDPPRSFAHGLQLV